MADYPDWTRLMQIIGSDVMVPVDIQAAYIMMPVDIQAQYVDVEVDIVAQTVGDITVDIAAASIGNIGIDIKAATIGNLTIDIEAQSIGVQLQPDWQTLQGNQKYFRVSGASVTSGNVAATNYEVPTGKTLYVTHIGGACHADAAANRDLPQICYMALAEVNSSILRVELGGDGGGFHTFPTPIKFVAGEIMRYQIWNFANHDCNIYMTVGGYEI
ncbi:MAG: hypothetical protein KKD77_22745 [Gammaproteobacteria bacterium]|nr:hypothetical protein [Gammaproteobacteria bacterium]